LTADAAVLRAETVALWLFDEQIGIYPSCVLSDASPNNFPLVLGSGGQIVKGKFGGSLAPTEQPKIELSIANRYTVSSDGPSSIDREKCPPWTGRTPIFAH